MIFQPTSLPGVVVIEPERNTDERGFFARTYCEEEFGANGLVPRLVQCSISFNPEMGTLRGMHYQAAPSSETRLVRCTMGAIYDVVIDLRPDSPTHAGWFAAELTAENRQMLFVPEGCAHGFLTLVNRTEIFYQMSDFYQPTAAGGVRWDDPAFGVEWPATPRVISDRDASYPDYRPDQAR